MEDTVTKTNVIYLCKIWKELVRAEYLDGEGVLQLQLQTIPKKRLRICGICVLNLRVTLPKVELMGRLLCDFHSHSLFDSKGVKFSRGDMVGIFESNSKEEKFCVRDSAGIVDQVTDTYIRVAVDVKEFKILQSSLKLKHGSSTDWKSIEYDLAMIGSDVTYQRSVESITNIREQLKNPTFAKHYEFAFGNYTCEPWNHQSAVLSTRTTGGQVVPASYIRLRALNECQKDVLEKIVCDPKSRKPIYCVQGPPGTGKTVTIANLIFALVNDNKKVLATAPSNTAVDNLMECCIAIGLRHVVRIGRLCRFKASLHKHSLENRIESAPSYPAYKSAMKRISKCFEGATIPPEVYAYMRTMERRCALELANQCPVVFATCCSAALPVIDDLCVRKVGDPAAPTLYDVCVIDEAGQCIEPVAWIPILKSHRTILVGDHQQLPPTVISRAALHKSQSLLERMFNKFKDITSSTMATYEISSLSIQYRMAQEIMRWSSEEFYEGRLIAHESVALNKLEDIVGHPEQKTRESKVVSSTVLPEFFRSSLVWIDTKDYSEHDISQARGDTSRWNGGEAAVVISLVKFYIEELSLKHSDVGVISPYKKQVELIAQYLEKVDSSFSSVQISTIDAFQGQEKEVIIITMVRSNDERQIGFLSELRRINVAVTRGKRQVVVVGNANTVTSNKTLKKLHQLCVQYPVSTILPNVILIKGMMDETPHASLDNHKELVVSSTSSKRFGQRFRKSSADGWWVGTSAILEDIRRNKVDSHQFPSGLSHTQRQLIQNAATRMDLKQVYRVTSDGAIVMKVQKKHAVDLTDAALPENEEYRLWDFFEQFDSRSKAVDIESNPSECAVVPTKETCEHKRCTRTPTNMCGCCAKQYCISCVNLRIHKCSQSALAAVFKFQVQNAAGELREVEDYLRDILLKERVL